MKFVLDANVGIKWVLVEDLSDKARELREQYRAGAHELIAPDVFPIEAAHTLSRATRTGRITQPEADAALAGILHDSPQYHSYLPLLRRAFEISLQARIGVYDCLYVALAEREACELITADEKLVKNLQVDFPFIVSLSSL